MTAPVLIAGAGIAGLTLALALARHRIACRVMERRGEPSESGAGIQLSPNAMQVLTRLGVAERLAPRAGVPEAIRVATGATGRVLGHLPLGRRLAERHGAPYWVAHRADLLAALLDAVRAAPTIELSTGVEITGWDEMGGGSVAARTASGATIEGSALVGADGLWSAVRAQMFPDHALTYSGKMAVRTVIDADAGLLDPGMAWARTNTGVWLGRDAHVVHYPIRGGRDIAVVAIVDEPVVRDGWAGEIDRANVLARLAGFAPGLRAFLEQASEWRVWSLYDPAPLPSWSRGRVAVMGDAAHPILPFMAQGGAMAIEAAETLAGALARFPEDPSAAFEAVEAARRARVLRAQMTARDNGRIYHLHGLTGFARDTALSVVPGRLMMARYDWLYGWNGDVLI